MIWSAAIGAPFMAVMKIGGSAAAAGRRSTAVAAAAGPAATAARGRWRGIVTTLEQPVWNRWL